MFLIYFAIYLAFFPFINLKCQLNIESLHSKLIIPMLIDYSQVGLMFPSHLVLTILFFFIAINRVNILSRFIHKQVFHFDSILPVKWGNSTWVLEVLVDAGLDGWLEDFDLAPSIGGCDFVVDEPWGYGGCVCDGLEVVAEGFRLVIRGVQGERVYL